MKYAAALLAVALVCAASVGWARPKTHPAKVAGPTIVKQEPGGAPDRVMLTIKNPLGKGVWVYIECPNVLTVEPIGIDAHRTSKLNLLCPGGPGDEPCRIHHWAYRGAGAPERWEP